MANKETNQAIRGRVITNFEFWKERRGADLGNRPGLSYAIARSAVDQALHEAALRELPEWSPNVARELADYFFANHPEEFGDWVRDGLAFWELIDSKRQRQVIVFGTRLALGRRGNGRSAVGGG